MEIKDVQPEQYAAFHPGGALGRSLMRVAEVMRTGADCPRLGEDASLADYDSAIRNAPRRAGGAAIVAPIFKHGEGRGATGCVAVSPPVFLSAEEALHVIKEELTQQGVNISDENVQFDSVSLPRKTLQMREDWVSGQHGIELVEVPDSSAP